MYKEYRTTLPYSHITLPLPSHMLLAPPTHIMLALCDPLPAMPGGIVKGILGNLLALLPSDNLQQLKFVDCISIVWASSV